MSEGVGNVSVTHADFHMKSFKKQAELRLCAPHMVKPHLSGANGCKTSLSHAYLTLPMNTKQTRPTRRFFFHISRRQHTLSLASRLTFRLTSAVYMYVPTNLT